MSMSGARPAGSWWHPWASLDLYKFPSRVAWADDFATWMRTKGAGENDNQALKLDPLMSYSSLSAQARLWVVCCWLTWAWTHAWRRRKLWLFDIEHIFVSLASCCEFVVLWLCMLREAGKGNSQRRALATMEREGRGFIERFLASRWRDGIGAYERWCVWRCGAFNILVRGSRPGAVKVGK